MTTVDQRLTRIGVFYDGNFFIHVSNFYRYVHERQKSISVPGLHEFIRQHVADQEGVDVRFCQIVDAHFFRGRISAKLADERQKLYAERVFDDILMHEGVVTHYLPLRQGSEKGIDVWLALEAFELAVYKRFNVLVLIAGDSDFIPLARKVNSLGTRVMVLGWDFKFMDSKQQEVSTTTSVNLLEEVTYPVMMQQIIDDKTKRENPLIKNMFVADKPSPPPPVRTPPQAGTPPLSPQSATDSDICTGNICGLNAGFGFIRSEPFPNNVFFHFSALTNRDFNTLKVGEPVKFSGHMQGVKAVADEVEVLS
jgi:uncharacterized LabA/DUF88 family protein/cold shock CspA family protein